MIKTYTLTGVCPKAVTVATDRTRCLGFHFEGGCDGNLKALSCMCEGMEIADIVEKLENVRCGCKETSCAAELAKILKGMKE